MSARVPAFPQRPDEVPQNVALGDLLAQYHAHQYEILVARHQPRGPVDAGDVFAHAVAALALLHVMVDRLQAVRWETVTDALAADTARAAEVAAACGLDGSEVAAGLRSWTDGQHAQGLMTDAERDVVELLAYRVGGAR